MKKNITIENTTTKIAELYVFVACNEDGEGIVAHSMDIGNGQMLMPLVCTQKGLVELLKPKAIAIGKETKRKIKLLKFTTKEVIEEYEYDQ